MTDREISDLIIDYVLALPDRELAAVSVTKLAKYFDLNRYRISRQFKRQTEMTLEDFLYRQKMVRACILLKIDPGVSIKEISERLGFCTSDYFIRKFRQFYGAVPGKFKDIGEEAVANSSSVTTGGQCKECHYRLEYLETGEEDG